MAPLNHVIKAEVHNATTVMRLFNQARESEVYVDFRHLLDELNRGSVVHDAQAIVDPFLALIVSSSVEEVCDVALQSVHKFLLYGLVSPSSFNAREAVNKIVRVLTRLDAAEFWGVSEVATMRVVEVLLATLHSPAGHLLTDRSIWDLWCSVHRLSQGSEHSMLLRRSAETSMAMLVLTVFSRLGQCVESAWEVWEPDDGTMAAKAGSLADNEGRADPLVPPSLLVSPPPSPMAGPSAGEDTQGASAPGEGYGLPCMYWLLGRLAELLDAGNPETSASSVQLGLRLLNIALEAGGTAFSAATPLVTVIQDSVCKHLLRASQAADLLVLSLTLRAVFNLFYTVREHLKVQLEVFFSSMHLRLGPVRPGAAAENGRGADAVAGAHGGVDQGVSRAFAYAGDGEIAAQQREITVESLVEFCREPWLLVDLYVNYDCDMQCSNLFENLASRLAQAAITGPARRSSPTQMQHLCFEGVLAMLDSIAAASDPTPAIVDGTRARVSPVAPSGPLIALPPSSARPFGPGAAWSGSHTGRPPEAAAGEELGDPLAHVADWEDGEGDGDGEARGGGDGDADDEHAPLPLTLVRSSSKAPGAKPGAQARMPARLSAAALRARKRHKMRLTAAAERFNQSPSKSVPYLTELGLVSQPPTGEEMAAFLMSTPALDKVAVGDYLSLQGDLPAATREAFTQALDFRNQRLDDALRQLLAKFRLPGEAQKIERILETFSTVYFAQEPGPLADADTAFVLAYSVIMLNTDLHNPSVRHKMTKEGFLRNNRGISGGEDLPADYLGALFDAIQTTEIEVTPSSHGDGHTATSGAQAWGQVSTRPPQKYGHPEHTRDMFLLVWEEVLSALHARLEAAGDLHQLDKVLQGCDRFLHICGTHRLDAIFNKMYVHVCSYGAQRLAAALAAASGDGPAAILRVVGRDRMLLRALRSLFVAVRELGSLLRETWRNVVGIMVELLCAGLLPSSVVDLEDFPGSDGRPLPSCTGGAPMALPCLPAHLGPPQGPVRSKAGTASARSMSPSARSSAANSFADEPQAEPSAGRGANGLLSFLFGSSAEAGGPGPGSGPPSGSRHGSPEQDVVRTMHAIAVDEMFADSRFLSPESLTHLANALMLELSRDGRDGGHRRGGSLASKAFCLEALTNVALYNHARIDLLWPRLSTQLDLLLFPGRAPSRPQGSLPAPESAVVERGVVCVLRLAARLLHKPELQESLVALVCASTVLPSRLLRALSERIATGISLMVRGNATHLVSVDQGGTLSAGSWERLSELLAVVADIPTPAAAHVPVPAPAPAVDVARGVDAAADQVLDTLQFIICDSGGALVQWSNFMPLTNVAAACARDGRPGRVPRALVAVHLVGALQVRAWQLRLSHETGVASPASADAASWARTVALSPVQRLCDGLREGMPPDVGVAAVAEIGALLSLPDEAGDAGGRAALETLVIPFLEEMLLRVHAGASDPAGARAATQGEETQLCIRLCAVVTQALLHHLNRLSQQQDFGQMLMRLVGTLAGALPWTANDASLQPLHEAIFQQLKNMLMVINAEGVLEREGQSTSALLWRVLDSFSPGLRSELGV